MPGAIAVENAASARRHRSHRTAQARDSLQPGDCGAASARSPAVAPRPGTRGHAHADRGAALGTTASRWQRPRSRRPTRGLAPGFGAAGFSGLGAARVLSAIRWPERQIASEVAPEDAIDALPRAEPSRYQPIEIVHRFSQARPPDLQRRPLRTPSTRATGPPHEGFMLAWGRTVPIACSQAIWCSRHPVCLPDAFAVAARPRVRRRGSEAGRPPPPPGEPRRPPARRRRDVWTPGRRGRGGLP